MPKLQPDARVMELKLRISAGSDKVALLLFKKGENIGAAVAGNIQRDALIRGNDLAIEDNDAIVAAHHLLLDQCDTVALEDGFEPLKEFLLRMHQLHIATLTAAIRLYDKREAELLPKSKSCVRIPSRADGLCPVVRKKGFSLDCRISHTLHEKICIVFVLGDARCTKRIEIGTGITEIAPPAVLEGDLSDYLPRWLHDHLRPDTWGELLENSAEDGFYGPFWHGFKIR